MCYKSINRYDDSLKTLQKFRNGGLILTAASLCYIGYSTFMIFVPTNFQYGMIISIAIATFSFTNLVLATIGIVKTKGKNILLREIKVTNLAAALTNIVLTQIAILSFTFAEDASLYNGLMGIGVGFIILIMGVVLSIRGQNKIIKFKELENKKKSPLIKIEPLLLNNFHYNLEFGLISIQIYRTQLFYALNPTFYGTA